MSFGKPQAARDRGRAGGGTEWSHLPACDYRGLARLRFALELHLYLLKVLGLLFAVGFSSATQAPRIFFSDLESGPNTGGQNNRGVFVTIWGKGFGAERGRSMVTV